MKYKKGDKVKIKTWKELEKEFGLSGNGNISVPPSGEKIFFAEQMEGALNKEAPDRILTIKEIKNGYYYKMEEIIHWGWADYMIKGLAEDEYIILETVSRFEIMDFDD